MIIASAPMQVFSSQTQILNSSPLIELLKRRLWLLIVFPYSLGIVWTCLHPLVSLATGELKCRGWFIDENSLDAGHFRYDAVIQSTPNLSSGIVSMCQAMKQVASVDDNIECYTHTDSFEIAKLVPISNSITPVSESIVLVIPSCKEWLASPYHIAMLQFMKHLATSDVTPWLAKTIMLVSPRASSNQTLTETVSTFLNSYLGATDGSASTLPPSYTASMIRNLLVLDVGPNKSELPLNEFLLMPHGRRGLLPNMDLVFLAMTVYSRASLMDNRRYQSNFVVHPHASASASWKQWVHSNLPVPLRNWLAELGDLVLFTRTLALGPYAAHAPALERGIDSLTLQIRYAGGLARPEMELTKEFFQLLEGMVRALSNLHERLHHSITQYLMPSPFKFVSHSEYLIPNLLMILPLVLRAVSLILWEIEAFDLSVLKFLVVAWSLALAIHEVSQFIEPANLNLLLLAIYGSIPMVTPSNSTRTASMYQSLHFLICLAAIYSIIPLILGNVSLAFPSALLFTPLIAMLAHRPQGGRLFVALPLLLILTWPPILMLRIFGYYSQYVTLVYLPLHLLLCILWVFKVRSSKT